MGKSSGSRAIDLSKSKIKHTDETRFGEQQRMNSWLVLVLFLISVCMLFVAFTSAYVARQQQPGWFTSPVPMALWLSTIVIAVSSFTIEVSRRAAIRGDWLTSRKWMSITGALGILFVLSQWWAWQQLVDAGYYMRGNPHSSFFYLLTAVHVLHLVGGLIALARTRIRISHVRPRLELAGKAGNRPGSSPRHSDDRAVNSVALTAVYWHFLGGLWFYLFALLFAF